MGNIKATLMPGCKSLISYLSSTRLTSFLVLFSHRHQSSNLPEEEVQAMGVALSSKQVAQTTFGLSGRLAERS